MFYAQKRRDGSEILGSNGIIMLDGRWSNHTAISYVKDLLSTNNLDNADSFTLYKGEKFTNSHPISGPIYLPRKG